MLEALFKLHPLCVCVAYIQGGRHVDYVTDQVVAKVLEVVKKKEKNAGINIKPFQVCRLGFDKGAMKVNSCIFILVFCVFFALET